MGMTSAAEANLDARVRPEISALRSRTPYPKRRSDLEPQVAAEQDAVPTATGPAAATVAAGPVAAGPVAAGPVLTESAPLSATLRATASATSADRPERADRLNRSDRPAPIRLTRRGRIVVWTLAGMGVAALATLIWLAVAGQAQALSHIKPGTPASGAVQRVVVRQGQTLWGIAAKIDPTVDPRVIIPEIVDLNSLNGTAIQVGQVLLVPRS